jgi:hypothetical protein
MAGIIQEDIFRLQITKKSQEGPKFGSVSRTSSRVTRDDGSSCTDK